MVRTPGDDGSTDPTDQEAALSRRLVLLLCVPLAIAALVVGGAWVYANVVEGDPAAELTLSDTTGAPAPSATAAGPGDWTVTGESQVGYRVDEVLFGQNVTAVGRTNEVTGGITLDDATVTKAAFTVDMASVTSDRDRRDGQYRSRIMAVSEFPTSEFALTEPIELGSLPADGATVTAKATGDLTLRGVTKPVTFDVKARRSGARMEVNGSIPLTFADWGIPSPSFGPAEVEDTGALEFLLVLAP
ncbi:MAG TPA: YceI family protein [Frankiaceae bacterium]|nr:YceI family protein [Frankiaceae bacterium]